jgi:hypothetical protein
MSRVLRALAAAVVTLLLQCWRLTAAATDTDSCCDTDSTCVWHCVAVAVRFCCEDTAATAAKYDFM